MAKQSVVDMAIAEIDAKIADLQRAKDIIINASGGIDPEVPARRERKPRRKRGLLTDQSNGE